MSQNISVISHQYTYSERSYQGTFEAHITIASADVATRERFRQVCYQLKVKCILIELPQGVTRSQPMTASYHRGKLQDVLSEVDHLARQLTHLGFEVTRTKVEALVNNQDVPKTDAEAKTLPAENYFEFHVQVTLPTDADINGLRVRCLENGAHLSTNAYKQLKSGQQKRFVTMRLYGVGRQTAEAHFEALLQGLKEQNLTLSNQLREYTVYDSNLSVDEGWIVISH